MNPNPSADIGTINVLNSICFAIVLDVSVNILKVNNYWNNALLVP